MPVNSRPQLCHQVLQADSPQLYTPCSSLTLNIYPDTLCADSRFIQLQQI